MFFFSKQTDYIEGRKMHIINRLVPNLLIILSLIFVYYNRSNIIESDIRLINIIIGSLMLLSSLSLFFWRIITDRLRAEYWPLHLCDMGLLVGSYMYLTNDFALFNIWFYLSIGGATQALATPNINLNSNHLRYHAYFLGHGLLVFAPIFTVLVTGDLPLFFYDGLYAYLFMAVFALIIAGFNSIFNTYFFFIAYNHDARPPTGSVLDKLGKHPYYIITLYFFAFLIIVVVQGLIELLGFII